MNRPRLVIDNGGPAGTLESFERERAEALAEYRAAFIARREAERRVIQALIRIADNTTRRIAAGYGDGICA